MVELFLIDENWQEDVVFGVATGAMFIIGNIITPAITLGVPVILERVNKILIGAVVAPIGEEFFFRSFLLSFLWLLLATIGLPDFVAFITADVVQAVGFALFHLYAYGMSNEAALYGAGVFGLVAGAVTYFRKSVVSSTLAHSGFNLWIVAKEMVVAAV